MRISGPPNVQLKIPTGTRAGDSTLATDPTDVKGRLERALEEPIRTSSPRSIAVSRRDGLVIVHRLQPGLDPRITAAMAAAMVGAAASTAQELRQGRVERVIIECTEGKIIALDAGPDAVIIALYDHRTNLGLALHGLTLAARTVTEILEEL